MEADVELTLKGTTYRLHKRELAQHSYALKQRLTGVVSRSAAKNRLAVDGDEILKVLWPLPPPHDRYGRYSRYSH